MNIKIPYVNTRIESDLLVTLLLIPLWWVTGLSLIAFHMAATLVFFKILTRPHGIKIPYAGVCLLIFSCFYLLSILINIGLRPVQRIIASLNNFSFIVLGWLVLVDVYNCNATIFFRKFLKVCRALCVITALIGIFFFWMWMQGHRPFEVTTLLGNKMPALMNYPYFYSILLITNTMSNLFTSTDAPRLTIYSTVPTATGGFMLVLIPIMMAYYEFHPRKRVEFAIQMLLSLAVLGLSMSRSAIYGFIFSFFAMIVLEKGAKAKAFFLAIFGVLLASGYLQEGLDWVLNIRKSSTVGRFELYEQAFKILMEENPLMGIGVHLRDGFTMMAIGSHALYIEILFVSGFIGLPLFLIFEWMVMKNWYRQKKYSYSKSEKILWRYLGMSLIALNIWIISDTLLGLPFTTYGYYLISGGVLLLGRAYSENKISENLFEESPQESSA